MVNIRQIVESIPDPEIPVLTLGDLGIVRDISTQDNQVVVTVSLTYSGCPATSYIKQLITTTLAQRDIHNVMVQSSISPPWTSAWISEAGRQKLLDYGIAPPDTRHKGQPQQCPQCSGQNIAKLSEFSSTPCQALWQCKSCLETFNYFKCI